MSSVLNAFPRINKKTRHQQRMNEWKAMINETTLFDRELIGNKECVKIRKQMLKEYILCMLCANSSYSIQLVRPLASSTG